MQSLTARTDEPRSCDVLVAGGGVAGVAAAVAAARGGCRTILIEKSPVLGGIGVRGRLRTICGLYMSGAHEPTGTLNEGIVREIVAALRRLSPERTIERIGKVFVLPYATGDFEEALRTLCRNEQNLTVLLGIEAVAVDGASGRIIEISVERNGERQNMRPKAIIDCTGNGDVAVLAGAESDLALPDERQMAGYLVRLRGLQGGDEMLALKVPYVLAVAVKKAELSHAMRYTSFTRGDEPDEGFLKFSVDGADSPDREHRAKESAVKAVRVLAERLPSFQHASLVETSGVLDREARRIRGEYCLTEDDVLCARKFSDGVVKNSWPIELWGRSAGTIYRYVPPDDYYEVPFRCLRVKGFENLLVAGRCISVTHEALGSTRVMGACMALGDAAGRAAAALVLNGRYPALAKA